MEKPLLNDPDVFPTPEVLSKTLGKSFVVLDELITAISTDDYETTLEWRFDRDSKAWLGNVCYKMKNIFWLSFWNDGFRVVFFFTKRAKPGVMELSIDETLKTEFAQNQPTGKLIPLSIKVTKKKQIKDVLQIVQYKKSLK